MCNNLNLVRKLFKFKNRCILIIQKMRMILIIGKIYNKIIQIPMINNILIMKTIMILRFNLEKKFILNQVKN